VVQLGEVAAGLKGNTWSFLSSQRDERRSNSDFLSGIIMVPHHDTRAAAHPSNGHCQCELWGLSHR
jgi:hypothetical protein